MTRAHVDSLSSEVVEQVRAVREGVGVADLSSRGKLCVTGRERASWLHGMVSNDVEGLQVGEGNYGTILTNRGKMLADYRLIVREDFLLFDVEPALRRSLRDILDRYLISEDATIHEDQDAWALLGVFGDASDAVARRVFGEDVGDLPMYHSILVTFGGVEVILARQNRTGERGYDLWVPIEEKDALQQALDLEGCVAVGPDALEVLRIEAGIPRYGVDMNDQIIPLEAQLDHAIDWNKGCYVGQEIVARMHYRGHPNKLLMRLRFDADAVPAPETAIFSDDEADKPIGWVTSATRSPTRDDVVGLGYVRAHAATVGARYLVRDQKSEQAVKVVGAPLTGLTPH